MNFKSKKLKLNSCFFIATLLCILGLTSLHPQEKSLSKFFELENGLRVYLYEKHTLPLVNLSFGVNLGSKDESDETNGLVHLLEHYILFRGSESRDEKEVSRDIRRHGTYFNAYTGYDITIFEMSLLSKYLNFALENQKDLVFNLKLTQEELDKEKQIIFEEINQIQDDPIKYATSLAYQNLFQSAQYHRPLYGKKEVIAAATVEQMENFYKKYIIPSNCVMAIVGDINLEEIEEKVKKIFGELPPGEFMPVKFEKANLLEKNIEIKEEMDVNQAYLILGFIAPDYNHPDQYAMDVLVEILGRGGNPMLSQPLRQRRDLIRSISTGYNSLKYGGAVLFFLTMEPKFIKTVKREAIEFFKTSHRKNYSIKDYSGDAKFYAFDYLESAKNQIKLSSHKLNEKGLNIATSLVMFMLLNEDKDRPNYLNTIDNLKSSDLRKIARTYFTKHYVTVLIVPKKER